MRLDAGYSRTNRRLDRDRGWHTYLSLSLFWLVLTELCGWSSSWVISRRISALLSSNATVWLCVSLALVVSLLSFVVPILNLPSTLSSARQLDDAAPLTYLRLPFQNSPPPPEAPPRCRCRSLDSRLTFVRIPAFRGYVDKFAEKELTPSFPSLESCGRPFTLVWLLSNFWATPRIILHLLLPFTPVAHEWGSRCIEEKSQHWTTGRMGSTQFGQFNVRSENRLVTIGGTLLTCPITTEILPRFYPSSL